MNTTLTRRAAALAALLALALTACASNKPALGEADALDRRRDGALAVFLDRKVTDSLDTSKNDSVDWKYVDVNKAGEIRVAVAFDDPDRVKGEVVLRDTFGAVIERQRLTAARGLYAFAPINAVRGRYYIEIAADSGASVYTVGVLFEEPDLGRFFAEGGRSPGQGLTPAPRPRATGGAGGGGRANPPKPEETAPEETTPAAQADPGGGEPPPTEGAAVVTPPPTPPPEDPDAGSITVNGSIQRLTPLDEGGTMLAIVINGEYGDQIKPGTAGVINGLGARVVVRSRSGNIARAFTKIEADQLQPYKQVTFRFKP